MIPKLIPGGSRIGASDCGAMGCGVSPWREFARRWPGWREIGPQGRTGRTGAAHPPLAPGVPRCFPGGIHGGLAAGPAGRPGRCRIPAESATDPATSGVLSPGGIVMTRWNRSGREPGRRGEAPPWWTGRVGRRARSPGNRGGMMARAPGALQPGAISPELGVCIRGDPWSILVVVSTLQNVGPVRFAGRSA